MSADNPLYFFSYSRQELYFAESAVAALQNAGLKIWFDLQQLEPGSIWADEIQRGLDNCAGVILLASRAALNSPWVALEWLDALEKNKPVYVILFEAVAFDPIPASEKTNNAPIPLDRLKNEAVAILDMRRSFRQNIARLADVVKKGERVLDAIPMPNRWRIPTVMPLAVAFVALSLALLTGVALWMSLYGFSIYWPMMLGGLAAAAWLGERTLAFLQRRSFREPRGLLPIAALLSPLISLWLTPIFVLGAVLVNFSPDVERWSPLGQGTDRHRSRTSIPTRRFFQRPTLSGKSYRVVAAPEDQHIAGQIHREMQRAGHKNSDQRSAISGQPNDQSADQADFTILVLSNYTPDAMLKMFAESDEKIICVAASALDDWQRFKPLSRYQFVDYRRQQRTRLRAMAFDILNIGSDQIGFSTHQTPQAFEKLILPGPVASTIGVMYIGLYVLVASTMRAVFVDGHGLAYMGLNLIVSGVVTLWLMIRATRREISIPQLLAVSVAIPAFNLLLGILLDPALAGIDPGGLLLATIAINSVFYFLLYGLLLRNWLPARSPRLKLSLRRDLDQWRFNLLVALVSGLFAVTFLGNRYVYATTTPTGTTRVVSYEGQMTLDVPDYWHPADSADFQNTLRRKHDFIIALERASSPIGQRGLGLLNAALFGDDRVPAIIPMDLVELFAQQVDLGVTLVHDARYVPDAANGAKGLRFDLWAYPRTFLYAEEARLLLDGFASSAAAFNPAQPASEVTEMGDITRYEQHYLYDLENPLDPTAPAIPFEFRFVIFDTPGTEFWLMFSGDTETMEAEFAAIGRVIESARFEVTPTPLVEVALENLRFSVPANWQTVTIPDVNDPTTWEGSPVADYAARFFQDAQAFSDQFGVASNVIWGAQVAGLGQPVAIVVSRLEDASTLADMLVTNTQLSLQNDGVELVDDQTMVLRADDLVVRMIQLSISGTSGVWFVGVVADNQPYLIQMVGGLDTLNGYADVLLQWFTSFDTVG